jgi:hypothetical protein
LLATLLVFRCHHDARLDVVGPCVDFGDHDRRPGQRNARALMLPRCGFSRSLFVGRKDCGPACHFMCTNTSRWRVSSRCGPVSVPNLPSRPSSRFAARRPQFPSLFPAPRASTALLYARLHSRISMTWLA